MPDANPVQVFPDSMNAGDVPAALAVLSDEVVVIEPEGLLYGGEYVGKEAFLGMFAIVSEHYSVEITSVDPVQVGDLFITYVHATYTSLATGRKLSTRFMERYSVAAGLITQIDVFPRDTRAMYELTVA